MADTCIDITRRNEIALGRRGENRARVIRFDCSALVAEYGDGTAQLLHQRSGDANPYIVQAVREGTDLIWTVLAQDTAVAGIGRAELRWYVGQVLAKSVIWATSTAPALADPDGTVPEEYHSAIELLIDAAGEAVDRATAQADRAEEAAERAEHSSGITYIHQQTVAADVWNIQHNMGKYPSVTVVDSGGNVVVGSVTYLNENSITATFAGAFSGTAYLN